MDGISLPYDIDHYNRHQRPFVWTARADSLFAKITRLTQRISETGH